MMLGYKRRVSKELYFLGLLEVPRNTALINIALHSGMFVRVTDSFQSLRVLSSPSILSEAHIVG